MKKKNTYEHNLVVNALGELCFGCDLLSDKDLDKFQRKIADRIGHLQELNTARFRIYGGIKKDGTPWIRLVTEFCTFMDKKRTWSLINGIAKELKAKVWILSEMPHNDKYAPPQGRCGEKILKETIISNGKRVHWACGPNHGRMERQVEFSWQVLKKSEAQIKAMIKRLRKATEEIWEEYGVGVI